MFKSLLVKSVLVGGLLIAGTSPALAQGATVFRSSPVSIGPIDNPCTSAVESITLTGFLLSVSNPSGNSLFQTQLSDTDYRTSQVFTSQDGDTRFTQLLISENGDGNFMVSGDSSSFTTKCVSQ